MKCLILISLFLLAGCNGLDRLLQGSEAPRNDVYEPSTPMPPETRTEPYGVFSGYSKYGDKIYLIHWTGDVLDKQGVLESIIDAMGITKYAN